MTDQGAPAPTMRAAGDAFARLGARTRQRLIHIFWATLAAIGLMTVSFLEPVDQFVWLLQSRVANKEASGDIVFASVDGDFAGGAQRLKLARQLEVLDRQGVGQVFIDVPIHGSSNAAADTELSAAIAQLGRRVVLVDHLVKEVGSPIRLEATDPSIGGRAEHVLFVPEANYLGLTWQERYSRTFEGQRYRTLASALAGIPPDRTGSFVIDYGIAADHIPSAALDGLATSRPLIPVTGKTVVIGDNGAARGIRYRVPGKSDVPRAYISIYGAETLKSGRYGYVPGFVLVLLLGLSLAIVVLLAQTRRRRFGGYAAAIGGTLLVLYGGALFGIRSETAYSLLLLGLYSLFRFRDRWQDRAARFDPETGLPTMRALEDWLTHNAEGSGNVVIARIHGYEHVLRTLRTQDHAAYTVKLADRLRAVDKDMTIYCSGHYFGWHSNTDNVDALVEHLAGLRAIFAAPVQVGENSVDVGITFGIARLEGDATGCIAAATAAVEEANEAIDPIRVAAAGSEIDLLWDISLRARIDEAMEAGEIYCVYQPKIDIVAQRMVGVEALVRWHDPAKGFIPPMRFIQQCEKAGRMEHLTRYVLQSACSAGKLLHFRDQQISMSVNISATLLTDMRICGIVKNVLQATGFDPHYLVLEVTETARIGHFDVAGTVIAELKAMGIRISMDDFGVGAANFETFFELPFDEIKIDRLFISKAIESAKARAIISSVVAMGESARIGIVAEGAESLEDVTMLESLGIRAVQGFALSRPLSLSSLLEFRPDKDAPELRNIV